MRHAALLDRSRTALVLIDLQEGYRPALHRWDRVVAASTVLVRGAAMLDVPLLVTEQYPRGLGHTAAEVASHFPLQPTITEKMSMSCCGAAAFLERLRETRLRPDGAQKKKAGRPAFFFRRVDPSYSVLVLDLLPERHFALVDSEGEAALGIRAHPGLEHHGGPLLPVVGERDQEPVVALLAL